ncbi:hypothetical protein [Hungatella hathewayi]|uniref:hypothetical protein n=1 Tax=Hungatella hathewayi TaxID=154046 RepID=UPI00356B071F
MISKKDKIQKLALTLKESDILMCDMEAERDESLKNIRFDGEEELLEQYYKKNLTSVYRIRNNAAALLLRSNCTCLISEDNTKLYLYIDDRVCEFSIPTIKNILQGDFDKILEKNRTENPIIIYLDLEKPNQTSTEKPIESNLLDRSVKPEAPKKVIQKDTKPSENKPVVNVKPKAEIKPEKIDHSNKNNSAISKPKEMKEVAEDTNDGMDDFFWEDVPKENIGAPIAEPAVLKEVIKETNQTITAKVMDDEPLWDIDDDLFSPQSDFDKKNASDKLVSTIKENMQREHKIYITPVTSKKTNINEEFHADYPLQNKEDSFIYDHDVSLEWSDDMGLTEQDNKTPNKQVESFQFQEPKEWSQTTPEAVQTKSEDVTKQNKVVRKTEGKEDTERFRFDKLTNDAEEVKEEEISTDLIFSSETIDMDPEEILQKLKDTKSSRERAEIEQQILSESNAEVSSGAVFDMSTGKKQTGNINVEREANKIGEVAEGVMSTSKKDTLADKKMELDLTSTGSSNRYSIQLESDYTRKLSDFLYDKCKLTINMYDEADELIKAEEAELIIFPLKIPESGNSLVTDICAYLEANGESHIAAVSPGGKTTVAIKSEEYAVFIRGSWENGNFVTAISVIGVGMNVKVEIEKDERRPENLIEAGIGHNVLYIDHITTVHIIPRGEENNLYEGDYVDFIAVIVRDYGIDQDCETAYTNHDIEMKIKGERYKYNLIGKWDNEEFGLKLMAK